MSDLVIRPSKKTAIALDMFGFLLAVGGILAVRFLAPDSVYWWLGAVPGVILMISGVIRIIAMSMESLTISNERLRYENGFISKSTHTIDLARVQDVRVDQSVKQRMLGIGRLSIETAGGSSAIGINNVDSPQKLADMILERSRQNPHHL